MKKEVKKFKSDKDNTILKASAICGILVFVVSVLSSIINQVFIGSSFLGIYSIIQGIIINILMIGFIYGFFVLGKRYNSKLLRIISVLIMVLIIISYFASLFVISPVMASFSNLMQQKATSLGLDVNNLDDTQAKEFSQALLSDESFAPLVSSLIFPLLIYVLAMIILYVLFGSALIKLRDKVEYSRTTGILAIVGASLMIILIGFAVMIVAYVFGIVLLYKESRKIIK